MKNILSFLILFLPVVLCYGQRLLPVTTDQTVSLVFPDAVIHADRGTGDILVQLIKESGRIILVKAACRNFHPTSLSVLTADGNIYTFIVKYDSVPASLVHRFFPEHNTTVAAYAGSVLARQQFIKGVKDKSWGVHANVGGIYIQDSIIYYQIGIANDSPIGYDIDQLRFYIRDRRTSKRTTAQENELFPLYNTPSKNTIPANQRRNIVVAFEKFTIPDEKLFVIELTEKNGGRKLRLKVKNRKIIHAIPLPVLIN